MQVNNSISTQQCTLPAPSLANSAICCHTDETDDIHRVVTTVFELAGQDQPGLLADVTHLLTTNGCDVRSAAVSVA